MTKKERVEARAAASYARNHSAHARTEELEATLRLACDAIVQLADERDAAVRILSAPPSTVARVEGETKDETIDRLHKVLHERNQAWAWERRERERAEAAEAGWKAQRDAALADVETLKREILAVARQAADLNKTTEDQRDRALALLRRYVSMQVMPATDEEARALLAEVDK